MLYTNFFGDRKKIQQEVIEIEVEIDHKNDLIKNENVRRRNLEKTISDCRDTDPLSANTYEDRLKTIKTTIEQLTNEIEQLKQQKEDKEKILKNPEKLKSIQEELTEEEKLKLQEEDKRLKEEEEKFFKQQKKKNELIFEKFDEFSEEFKDFAQQKEQPEGIDSPNAALPEKIDAVSLLQDENIVKQRLKTALLYVATFFPKLTVEDFERVVVFILEEQKVSVKVTSKVTTEKGETQLIEAEEESELTKIWQESQVEIDELFGACHLKAIRLEGSLKTINFSPSYLRKEIKIYFEEQLFLYLEKHFKRLKFLLFDSSARVTINTIDFSVEMAISNPESYCQIWLCSLLKFLHILDLADFLAQESGMNSEQCVEVLMVVVGLDQEQRKEFQLFYSLLKPVGKKQRREFVRLRVSALISKILEKSELKDEVKNFFDWAIHEKYQDDVLEIIKPLYSVQNFNQLYWLKQLLDRGNLEVSYKAYIFLAGRLDRDDSRIYELLKEIKDWLPEPERPFQRYFPSNEFSLRLIFEYSWGKLSDLKPEDYGCWPSEYPLFYSLKDGSVQEDLKVLVDWIFHPGLRYIIDSGYSITQVAGSLILDWFRVLWGMNKKEPSTEVMEVTNQLIDQVLETTNRTQQKELLQFWSNLSDNLLDEADLCSQQGDEKQRKQLMQTRTLARQLRKQFQELQKVKK